MALNRLHEHAYIKIKQYKHKGLGGKRGAGVPGYAVRGPGVWKTRDLLRNAGSGGKCEVPFFSPKYEFSSLKREARILLAYIAMNINSAPRPQMRCSINKVH